MYYVYVHRKATTGEVFYIGKGHGKRAFSKANRSSFWKNVVSKHGYVVEFLEKDLQEWYAFELEKSMIDFYGRKDLGYGCLVNLTDGGDGAAGHIWTDDMRVWRSNETKSQWQCEALREKFQTAMRGKKLSPEHAEKSRQVLLDQKEKVKEINSKLMKQKWENEEFRQKMTTASRDRRHTFESKLKIAQTHAKRVRRSDGVVFDSVADAARSLGKSHSKISMVAVGKRKTAYGFGWEYV